jgi:CBS domain containing-hemolysin-like protein
MPSAGDEVVWNDVRSKVRQASPRRIERIQILLPEPQPDPA